MASPLVRRASREDDYDENDRDPEAYPYRVLRKGPNNGFTLSIFFDRDILDIFSRRWVQEPKFILHSPDEMPRLDNFFRIPMGKDVKVLIKPQMVTTSEKLRNFSPKRRQCVYENERKLRYFKTYTQHHCGNLVPFSTCNECLIFALMLVGFYRYGMYRELHVLEMRLRQFLATT